MNNRSMKPVSLTKRKIEPVEFRNSILKCNGLIAALSLKNNKMDPQLYQLPGYANPNIP